MYQLARPFLFCLDAEKAHELGLKSLELAYRSGLNPLLASRPAPLSVALCGLQLPNPVGLAAGLDKNAAHVDALAALGFGFIEVGTTTPRPQPGNPRPRVFRLPEDEAVINRYGLNSEGMEAVAARLTARRKRSGIVGVNLGGLGFLTEITLDEIRHTLQSALEGDITIDRRRMLRAVVRRRGGVKETYQALNDAVLASKTY